MNPEQYADARKQLALLQRVSEDLVALKLITQDEEFNKELNSRLISFRTNMEYLEKQINDYDNT